MAEFSGAPTATNNCLQCSGVSGVLWSGGVFPSFIIPIFIAQIYTSNAFLFKMFLSEIKMEIRMRAAREILTKKESPPVGAVLLSKDKGH